MSSTKSRSCPRLAGWSIMRKRRQQPEPKERGREAPMVISPRRIVQLVRLTWKRRAT
jgi:hypothetical protein